MIMRLINKNNTLISGGNEIMVRRRWGLIGFIFSLVCILSFGLIIIFEYKKIKYQSPVN